MNGLKLRSFVLFISIVSAAMLVGCSDTQEGRTGDGWSDEEASDVYSTLSTSALRVNMEAVQACVEEAGISVELDVANGTFRQDLSGLPQGEQDERTGQIKDCIAENDPNHSDGVLTNSQRLHLFELHLQQAKCLEAQGFKVGEIPSEEGYLSRDGDDGMSLWVPFAAISEQLPNWAVKEGVSQGNAFSEVTDRCPDPARFVSVL